MKLKQLEISGVKILSAYRMVFLRRQGKLCIFHFDVISTTLIEII